jgi:hypothetical protein
MILGGEQKVSTSIPIQRYVTEGCDRQNQTLVFEGVQRSWPSTFDSLRLAASDRFFVQIRTESATRNKNLRCPLDLSDWRAVHDVTGRGDGKIMAIQMSIESQNLGMSNYGDVRSSRNYTLRGEITDRRTLSS